MTACGLAKTGALTMGVLAEHERPGRHHRRRVHRHRVQLGRVPPELPAIPGPERDRQLQGRGELLHQGVQQRQRGGLQHERNAKVQMLATALDVYFSDPSGPGGNKIGTPAPIGDVTMDLTKVCANPGTCSSYLDASPAFGAQPDRQPDVG